MNGSNIIYSSNVYLVDNTSEKNNAAFYARIFDYGALKKLSSKHGSLLPRLGLLSEFQLQIIKEGSICVHAKGDPCWGLIRKNNEVTWGCRCINTECKLFLSCRDDYTEKESLEFDPRYSSNEEIYRYDNSLNHDDIYFPLKFETEEEYIDGVSDLNSIEMYKLQDTKNNEKINVKRVMNGERISIVEKESTDEKIVIGDDDEEVSIFDWEKNAEYVEEEEEKDTFDFDPTSGINMFETFILASQEKVINGGMDEIYFVDAGPGTGKTYCLINKINYMVGDLQIRPDEILVLSFTNSAVAVIKKRLNKFVKNGGDRGLRNVDVRTFHSFAWYLLHHAQDNYIDEGWHPPSFDGMSFDTSVYEASRFIDMFPDVLGQISYFMVDEVQDLTGSTAQFVLSVIKACIKNGCGITALGDSCQAIYDYNVEYDPEAMTSDDFYNEMYRLIKNDGEFLRFEHNHRQEDDLSNLTVNLRDAILKNSASKMKEEALLINEKIHPLEKTALLLDDNYVEELRKEGNVCFLCRNNGQTLRLSTLLKRRNIIHSVQTNDNKYAYASWIAKIFWDYGISRIERDIFLDLMDREGVELDGYSALDIWEKIVKISDSYGNEIIVRDFLNSLKKKKASDPVFMELVQNDVIVSNIHRAKGREYDRVIIDESLINNFKNRLKSIGEYKTLYVAITRPKKNLNNCKMQFERMYYKKAKNADAKRWFVRNNGKITHVETGIENDIKIFQFIKDSCFQRQEYISTSIKPGDNLKIKREISERKIKYSLIHCIEDNETVLGYMSSSFVEDLFKIIPYRRMIEMPAYIEDIFVESICTHIADEQEVKFIREIRNYSPTGVWNWVNFRGMGHLIYDTY
ncbi:MAG: ATP-dependent helicase [Tindallia sp. MSAO_Bac2]|nr:MAG: ATP-dependent helicase [Tindallia sp. MSAO_Bac2]